MIYNIIYNVYYIKHKITLPYHYYLLSYMVLQGFVSNLEPPKAFDILHVIRWAQTCPHEAWLQEPLPLTRLATCAAAVAFVLETQRALSVCRRRSGQQTSARGS